MVKISKKIVITICTVLICSVTAFSLCSCDGSGSSLNPADAEKSNVTSYYAEVNSIVKEFTELFSTFSKDVKEKDTSKLQEKLDQSQELIDRFNKLTVPPGCEGVHDTYQGAFDQLQKALSDYVQVFNEFSEGQVDKDTLNQKIAEIQKSYKEAMNLLSKADKAANKN